MDYRTWRSFAAEGSTVISNIDEVLSIPET